MNIEGLKALEKVTVKGGKVETPIFARNGGGYPEPGVYALTNFAVNKVELVEFDGKPSLVRFECTAMSEGGEVRPRFEASLSDVRDDGKGENRQYAYQWGILRGLLEVATDIDEKARAAGIKACSNPAAKGALVVAAKAVAAIKAVTLVCKYTKAGGGYPEWSPLNKTDDAVEFAAALVTLSADEAEVLRAKNGKGKTMGTKRTGAKADAPADDGFGDDAEFDGGAEEGSEEVVTPDNDDVDDWE